MYIENMYWEYKLYVNLNIVYIKYMYIKYGKLYIVLLF